MNHPTQYSQPKVFVSTASDVGRKRSVNEDSLLTLDIREHSAAGPLRFTSLILADGMGGLGNGDLASKMVCEGLGRFSVDTLPAILQEDGGEGALGRKLADALGAAVAAINTSLVEIGEAEGKLGSTLVYALLYGNMLYYTHIGDSRLYHIMEDGARRERTIRQLTRDHSVVAALLDRGAITPAEAKDHPMSHVVTRSIGTDEELEFDLEVETLALDENCTLLLCSDGLTDMLDDDEIRDCFALHNPDRICRTLVARANEKGGKDNISMILARILIEGVKRRRTQRTTTRRGAIE